MKLGEGKRGNRWRELPLSMKLKAGDRRMYSDQTIGKPVMKDELHLTVGQAGYFGVVRRRS